MDTAKTTLWSGKVVPIEPLRDILGLPVLGGGWYFRPTNGEGIPVSNLRVVGTESLEYKKLVEWAEKLGFCLGRVETIACVARKAGFDAIYGGPALGLALLNPLTCDESQRH